MPESARRSGDQAQALERRDGLESMTTTPTRRSTSPLNDRAPRAMHRHAGAEFVAAPGQAYDLARSPGTLRLVRDAGPGPGLPGVFNNSMREPSAKVNSTSNGLLLDTFADTIC